MFNNKFGIIGVMMFPNILPLCIILSYLSSNVFAYTNIKDNSITSIPNNIPDEGTVYLYQNAIVQVLSTDLQGIPSLSSLRLDKNDITYVAPDAFSNNLNLRTLYLQNNELENITFGNELLVLTTVKLDTNSLNKMPVLCCIFPLLSSFSLQNNHITDIHSEYFSKLPALLTLNLGKNGLTSFEFYSQDFPVLKTLTLSENDFPSMPNMTIQSLEILTMETNGFTTVEKNYISDRLPQLKQLKLKSNELIRFEPQAMSNLELLDLSYNKLTQFDSAPLGLSSLRNLNIRSNQLSSPPNITTNQLGLQNLNMASNQFDEIPYDYLKPFLNLITLDISGLQLTVIPDLSHSTK